MTLETFLGRAEPPPPAALARRIAAAVSMHARAPVSTAPALLLDAAVDIAAALARDGCRRRDEALELLSADALITYAFEAGAGDPAAAGRLAGDAMRRLSALAGAAA